MYNYPTHYESRYFYPQDYSSLIDSYRPSRVTTHYYGGNPYITSYNDGRFELLRRTPIHSSVRATSLDREESPTKSYRASSIPPIRETSPTLESAGRNYRASSLPPVDSAPLKDPFTPSIVHFTPNVADPKAPTATYSYYTRLPNTLPGTKMQETPRRMYTANPVTFGPKLYTNLSVFPTMRYSSYALLTPIDRYKYRTAPNKTYQSQPSNTYYSYPTPTRSTSSAYRQSDLYPTRFQINRITYPSLERFYANRRTLY